MEQNNTENTEQPQSIEQTHPASNADQESIHTKKTKAQPAIYFLLIIPLVGVLSVFAVNSLRKNPATVSQPAPTPVESPANGEDNVACTTDIKQCEDGSYVRRTLPACEFEECPNPENAEEVVYDLDAPWVTYTNSEYGFSLEHPNFWYSLVKENYVSNYLTRVWFGPVDEDEDRIGAFNVAIAPDPNNQSLEEYVTELCDSNSRMYSECYPTDSLKGVSLDTYKIDYSPLGRSAEAYVFKHEDKFYFLDMSFALLIFPWDSNLNTPTWDDDKELHRQISDTFVFLQ